MFVLVFNVSVFLFFCETVPIRVEVMVVVVCKTADLLLITEKEDISERGARFECFTEKCVRPPLW